MTTITLPRAVVEQALHVAESAAYPVALIKALRAALAQQDEPVQEPVAWKQGNLVTFNEDPYPALGGLFVQFWDGEEVAARVYANDLKTLRQRCAKVNAAPPQRTMVPLTEEEIAALARAEIEALPSYPSAVEELPYRLARAVEKAVWEKNHGQA